MVLTPMLSQYFRNTLNDHDDGDEFISDVVEEVCGAAMDIIYQNYIQKQLIPYTVAQAKDALLQIIEVCEINCMYCSWII